MTEVVVTPEYLEQLAGKQDAASTKAGEAAGATGSVGTMAWVTHGVISGVSNGAFTSAEQARRDAGGNISTASNDLAAKLRTASEAYGNVDQQGGARIDKQVLDH